MCYSGVQVTPPHRQLTFPGQSRRGASGVSSTLSLRMGLSVWQVIKSGIVIGLARVRRGCHNFRHSHREDLRKMVLLEHRPGGGREEHLGAKGTSGSAQRWKSTRVCDEGQEVRGATTEQAARKRGRGSNQKYRSLWISVRGLWLLLWAKLGAVGECTAEERHDLMSLEVTRVTPQPLLPWLLMRPTVTGREVEKKWLILTCWKIESVNGIYWRTRWAAGKKETAKDDSAAFGRRDHGMELPLTDMGQLAEAAGFQGGPEFGMWCTWYGC